MKNSLWGLLLLCAACGSSNGDAPDAGPDSGPHPTPGVCLPDPTGTGNEENVGAFCSPGGGECLNYDRATLCAIDLDPEGDNFCIAIGCRAHDECGEQACCTGRVDQPVKACVPKGCLTEGDLAQNCPPIPYPDAGPAEAGTPD